MWGDEQQKCSFKEFVEAENEFDKTHLLGWMDRWSYSARSIPACHVHRTIHYNTLLIIYFNFLQKVIHTHIRYVC